jgi:uncharacterized protein
VAFEVLPFTAAWQHHDARIGFEVAWFEASGTGHLLRGCTTGLEDGATWAVSYEIHVDPAWITRSARIDLRTATGDRTLDLAADGEGHWTANGHPMDALAGCLDVDLESSAMTNTLPVHRLALEPGASAAAPAAYVRALGLDVHRLDQTYRRIDDDGTFGYSAPAFDFSCRLRYDGSGLVVDYPGIATRTPINDARLVSGPPPDAD